MAEESHIPPVLQGLSALVDYFPEKYVRGNEDIQRAALAAAQYIFELSVQSENFSLPPINDLLSSLNPSEAPQTRSQSKKRKRSPDPPVQMHLFNPTPLNNLFVDDLEEEQIWAQLDLKAKHMADILGRALEPEPQDDDESDDGREEALTKALEALGQDGQGDFDFGDLALGDDDEMDFSSGDLDDEDEEDSEDSDSSGEEPQEEGVMDLKQDPEDASEDEFAPGPSRRRPKSNKSRPASELDDGFFDLRTFNADTETSESRAVSSGRLDADDDSDEEPIDLSAPVEIMPDDDAEDKDMKALHYNDFFAPPRGARPPKPVAKPANDVPEKKKGGVRFHEEVRVKKIKAKGKNLPLSAMYDEEDDDEDEDGDLLSVADFQDMDDEDDDDEEEESDEDDEGDEDEDMGEDEDDSEASKDGSAGGDIEDDDDEGSEQYLGDTIDRFKDDLFGEEDEDPQKDMTTHEKRMALLQEQITTLEGENVGKKDWTLMGEATSRARPQNSLLEEDLEFERVMKAAPIITEEVVQGLEDRIKARILDNHFDDVVRKRAFEDKPFLPSRLFELKDTKSAQSLAQIYEDDYMAVQSGGTTDDRDGKLKKEHDEIDKLWDGICSKLDALCNAHFTPKQPKATISSISNVSTTTLESALPTTQSNATMLAPEEVFKPAASDLKSRTEMTPAEKRTLRGKVRKLNKKRRDNLDKAVDKFAKSRSGVKKQKEAALETAVKSGKGVTVVGKQRKDILQKNKKGKT